MSFRIGWQVGWRVFVGFLWGCARLPAYLVFFFIPLSFIMGIHYALTYSVAHNFDFAILALIPLIAILMVAVPIALYNGIVLGAWMSVRGERADVRELQYVALGASISGVAAFVGVTMLSNGVPLAGVLAGMVIWGILGIFMGFPASMWITENDHLLMEIAQKQKNNTPADWSASDFDWRRGVPFLQTRPTDELV
jgi:hypothetical protein